MLAFEQPFELVDANYDLGCKTVSSIDDGQSSRLSSIVGGREIVNNSLNLRGSTFKSGNAALAMRPSIPQSELSKRIDNLM